MNKTRKNLTVFAVICLIACIAFAALSFYKMLKYENGEHYPYQSVNAYVGGDAYNYIINGTYFTGYAVYSATCGIVSALCFIACALINTIEKNMNAMIKTSKRQNTA